MKRAERMQPQIYRLGAYDEVHIDGSGTVALLRCDMPYVLLRSNSDGIQLQEGACVEVGSNFTKLVNPFHFPISCVIALDYPPVQIQNGVGNTDQINRSQSVFYMNRAATVTGKKYAVGVMLQKGKALAQWNDMLNDGFSSVVLFPGCTADFLAYKPAGIMTDGPQFYDMTGKVDTNAIAVGGLYTDADVTAWCLAAGYTGQVKYLHASGVSGTNYFTISNSVAAFFVREADKSANGQIRLLHRGIGPEDLT